MPTKKPRVCIVLEQEHYDLYKLCADLQGHGTSVQDVMLEMLEMARPAVTMSVELLQRLHALPGEHQADILHAAEVAEGSISEVLDRFHGQLSMAEDLHEAAHQEPQNASDPRPSNTGVTFPPHLTSPPSSLPLHLFEPTAAEPYQSPVTPELLRVSDDLRKGSA